MQPLPRIPCKWTHIAKVPEKAMWLATCRVSVKCRGDYRARGHAWNMLQEWRGSLASTTMAFNYHGLQLPWRSSFTCRLDGTHTHVSDCILLLSRALQFANFVFDSFLEVSTLCSHEPISAVYIILPLRLTPTSFAG